MRCAKAHSFKKQVLVVPLFSPLFLNPLPTSASPEFPQTNQSASRGKTNRNPTPILSSTHGRRDSQTPSIIDEEESGCSHSVDVRWVSMSRKVDFNTLEDLCDSEDVSLEFDEPPRTTVLTIYRNALPELGRHRAFGFVHCVSNSGTILFSSVQGEAASDKYFLCEQGPFVLPRF